MSGPPPPPPVVVFDCPHVYYGDHHHLLLHRLHREVNLIASNLPSAVAVAGLLLTTRPPGLASLEGPRDGES